MPSPQIRIAIVGAGPAGLTLGVLLHKHGIPFTIFELRQQPTEEVVNSPRKKGFESLLGDCTEADRVCNMHGDLVYADEGELTNRPEIARPKLIKLLLSNLPASSVRWGHKLRSVNTSALLGPETTELDFGEHGKDTFDLVVGADGAWSRVRAFLTAEKPHYVGMHTITLDIRQIASKHPVLAQWIGPGSLQCLGNRHGICSQRSMEGSARIYMFLSVADKDFATTSGLGSQTAAQAKNRLLSDDSLFGLWGSNIKELVAAACEDESIHNPGQTIDIKPLYTLPARYTWEHHSCATLIGDAAHLMNPPAGQGVNLAMKDSLLLAQAIVKARTIIDQNPTLFRATLDALVTDFERNMAVAAKEVADMTMMINEIQFGSDDAATAMANVFKSCGESAR
ncbi:salicylate hydroxylase [Talaromyces islandicus]|uniref:Salicylate hydroxylase n=1 Tax=Talaromyces islandicus TaxID=28573 RepID=A0A0U1M841_TALIS|nr:salicylate hydroxylase [Talaromyces islandicus]